MDESPISEANIDSDPLNLSKLVEVDRSRATAPGPRVEPPQLASAHQPHSVPSLVTPPDAVAMAGSLAQRRIDRGTSQIEMENIYKQYKHFFFVTVHEHRPRSTACKRYKCGY